MQPREIQQFLKRMNYQLLFNEGIETQLAELLEGEIRVLTLCRTGIMRSQIAAIVLSEYGIPAICLEGGVQRIMSRIDFATDSGSQFIAMLEQVPHVAVILDRFDNPSQFAGFLNGLTDQTLYEDESAVFKAFS